MRTPARALMFQGTGSDVGKSLVVAALCRALTRRGLVVRPFKPQNMSNNAAPARDGGEIGRAQALQARACGVPPSVHMNPVLLKPQSETGAQVVVQGRVLATAQAHAYQDLKGTLLPQVLESFRILRGEADIVVVEGAGSPAEVNLRARDIANMGFARTADVPVVLVGDIDRGGVIASLVGTHAVLDAADRAMVAGFIINKFRGDPRLFDDGLAEIVRRTGWPGFGVLPWLDQAWRLPPEDAYSLRADRRPGRTVVAVPLLPRISNLDDLDPLKAETGVDLRLVPPGTPIPADAALVLLPGSKATIADLRVVYAQGWDVDIRAHFRRGGLVAGFCGGYQMLGRRIEDPHGLEGPPGGIDGLGLLDVRTVLTPDKIVREAEGASTADNLPFRGYEIHLGRTEGPDCARPLLRHADGRPDGAISADGRVRGAYVHGLLAVDAQRDAWLRWLGGNGATAAFEAGVDAALDAIADGVERHLDVDGLLALAR
ncbi:MAG TPA: cobyric acid synthase [Azospirillaceae bacterium]|nr:cobyric acid synthase [Azospirillaceae bacterium]